ncbi:uncharacterized protein LOC129232486 isoform X1 [Uloborus diversus]|uniref:uncharacterized protein LOC129232486 isoform X1 n=1 Tax=Uloborus diversus TaxID=327109 RepID=UPI00240A922B|nr:uncharacterized protein LOC129232486 isoform X1 [Uloborus diversus]
MLGYSCQYFQNDDDHDSGTESDDEGADAEELEKYMDDSLHCDVSSAPSDRASSTLDTITDTTTEGGGACGAGAELESASPNLLDSALPSDSDPNLEHHSSEEELEVINSCTKYPEKRKWSQVANIRLGSGSSDEEVRDLMCASAPVEFRASPPANVPKPSRSLSPPPKLFHHASNAIPPHELCSVSPRKRHRRTLLTTTSTNVVVHRPSLDFEKMQQNRRKRTPTSIIRGKSYILCENV